jgi:hypothetical protein
LKNVVLVFFHLEVMALAVHWSTIVQKDIVWGLDIKPFQIHTFLKF